MNVLNNPVGAIVTFNSLKFVREQDYDDVGVSLYKNSNGIFCARNNPCRDSIRVLRNKFIQNIKNNSYTGECLCSNGFKGVLCQCSSN